MGGIATGIAAAILGPFAPATGVGLGLAGASLFGKSLSKKDDLHEQYEKELDELIDSFANKFIIYLNLEEDKFGALYQVMYLLATIICDCTIDEKERKR